jgi:7-cyano-7-deazaguanine synthase in queuosine biosynthesis
MIALAYAADADSPSYIDVVMRGDQVRPGAAPAYIGETLKLSTTGLESYFFAQWQPILFDLLVVAAAIEFCDVVHRRPAHGWSRRFDLCIAVHDAQAWNKSSIIDALSDAAGFLTGDLWSFSFSKRSQPAVPVREQSLQLGASAKVIMPYSDGLDSRAVAALIAATDGGGLVRVRLGAKGSDPKSRAQRRQPFTAVPYKVSVPRAERRESSARSRGFKFAVVTGIAAHLANVSRIIVTESGQGALGPVLAVTGHAYPDYRVHPAFSRKMERLFEALLGRSAGYEYPRLWSTKGETLAAAASLPGGFAWSDTRSCWQQSRQAAVDGRRRQCGICAACLLRRMSMYTAGLSEAPETYVWNDLSAPTFREAAAAGFSLFTKALEQYAIAGVLHLDHLAALAESELHVRSKRRVVREVAAALHEGEHSVAAKLESMLLRHRVEWLSFLNSLGSKSFIGRLASVSP